MPDMTFPDVITAIHQRKSVRKYSDAAVPESVLDDLIYCATCAPTGNNRQPWRFVVINDPATLSACAEIIPAGKMLLSCKQAIVFCVEFENELLRFYGWLDASAAVENLLLAAQAHGIGGVWLGVAPRIERIKAISALLELPPNIEPMAVVALGFPAETATRKRKPKPAQIWKNRWGNP